MLKHEYQSVGFLELNTIPPNEQVLSMHSVPSDVTGSEKIKILRHYPYSQETYSP